MHYHHVIALAQMCHDEHQDYARQAARTGARRHPRKWRHLRARLIPTSGPLPKGRKTRKDTPSVGEAISSPGAGG